MHCISGCQYINKIKYLENVSTTFLNPKTSQIIQNAQQHHNNGQEKHGAIKWREIVKKKVFRAGSKKSVGNAFVVGQTEHMQGVDCFDGETLRGRKKPGAETKNEPTGDETTKDLITIRPIVDGRLRDVARDN